MSAKVVVVGDGSVGKTSLLIRLRSGCFPTKYDPTDLDSYSANVMLNGKMVNVDMWDTGGRESDRMRVLTYPLTDVFLLCFSVDNWISLSNLKTKWWPEVSHHVPRAAIVLCGTKTDLRKDPSTIEMLKRHRLETIAPAQGKELMAELGAHAYVECSALHDAASVKRVFDAALAVIATTTKQGTATNGKRKQSHPRCIVV